MLPVFIESNNLAAKIINCRQQVNTVKQACDEMHCTPEEIIKSIVFLDEKKNCFLAIVLGSDRISVAKLEKAVETKNLKIASEKEIFEITGYEAGGIPPIGIFGVRTIIDKKVMLKESVIGGGGDNFHLLQISTKELLANAFEASVEEIAE